MGHKLAMEIAQTEAPLELKIHWHLAANFYPPVPEDFVPVVTEAVRLAYHGDTEDTLPLPNGLTKSVAEIIDQLNLEPFTIDWNNQPDLEVLIHMERDWMGGEYEEQEGLDAIDEGS